MQARHLWNSMLALKVHRTLAIGAQQLQIQELLALHNLFDCNHFESTVDMQTHDTALLLVGLVALS